MPTLRKRFQECTHRLSVRSLRHQQARIFPELLAGRTIANAQSERGTRHVRDFRTTLLRDGDAWRLTGTKFYCTGSLFADWLAVLAHLGEPFFSTRGGRGARGTAGAVPVPASGGTDASPGRLTKISALQWRHVTITPKPTPFLS